MANVNISEYRRLLAPAGQEPALVRTKVTYTTATTHTCNAETQFVRISPIDADVYYIIDKPLTSPVADDNGTYITQGSVEWSQVPLGGAVISVYDGIS